MKSRMRLVWPLALLLLLPGCASKPTPSTITSATPAVEWPEWKPVPLALLGAQDSQLVWYSSPGSMAPARTTAGGAPAALTKSSPPPAPPKPEPAKRRGKVALEYVEIGKTVKLEASAEGTLPFVFQWKKSGRPLAGAVFQQLKFAPFTAEDAGEYVCVVSNAYGSAESHPVRLIARKP
jgi:hypothetical protein